MFSVAPPAAQMNAEVVPPGTSKQLRLAQRGTIPTTPYRLNVSGKAKIFDIWKRVARGLDDYPRTSDSDAGFSRDEMFLRGLHVVYTQLCSGPVRTELYVQLRETGNCMATGEEGGQGLGEERVRFGWRS